jgi:hypothetical protein
MPEFFNGKNVADFIDPDIEAKLEALEREEEALEAQGFYASDEEEIVSLPVLILVYTADSPARLGRRSIYGCCSSNQIQKSNNQTSFSSQEQTRYQLCYSPQEASFELGGNDGWYA